MNDEAYNFWERWDLERKRLKKSVKDIAQAIDISYDLLRTQRSRTIFPSLPVACWLADSVGSTVEYLVTGKKSDSELRRLCRAYREATNEQRMIVDLVLKLTPDNSKQKAMA